MMPHNSKKRAYLLGYALFFIQSILILLICTWNIGQKYNQEWQNYFVKDSYGFQINDAAISRKDHFSNYLKKYSVAHNLLVARIDHDSNDLKISIIGTANPAASLTFLGKTIFDSADLQKLLTSNDNASTIGIGTGSVHTVKSTPQFNFSEKATIYQLDHLIDSTGTINGRYYVKGIKSPEQYNELISKLAQTINEKPADLRPTQANYAEKAGIFIYAIYISLFSSAILLICYFAYIFIKEIPTFGILVLLGWTKTQIIKAMFKPFFSIGIIVGLINSFAVSVLLLPSDFYLASLTYVLLGQVISIGVLILIFVFAASIVFVEKNINLVKGVFSKKILYLLAISLYLAAGIGITAGSIYVDRPMKSIVNNAQQAQQWQNVSHYQILEKMTTGQDGIAAYTDTGSILNHGIYELYREIENKKGVYLINSTYNSEQWLNQSRENDAYHNLPSEPFWQMTVSPNYFSKLNIPISKSVLKRAEAGVRVYLVPKHMYSKKMISYLKEDATDGISENDVQTTFVKRRRFLFVPYVNKNRIFTWNDNPTYSTSSKDPVIFLCTAKNMNYVEIGNLMASGIAGNLKFASKKARKIAINKSILAKNNLTDNQLQFASVQKYIDGLQKELWQTISLFIIIIVVFIVVLILAMQTILSIYRLANSERIMVKKFLGFSYLQLYRMPLLIICGVNLVELLAVLVMHSKIGVVAISIIWLIQLIFFHQSIYKNRIDAKQL